MLGKFISLELKFGFGGVTFGRYFNTDVIIINIYD